MFDNDKIKKIPDSCEAILFDKDGTLIDFNFMWIRWSREAARFISGKTDNLPAEEILTQWGVDAQAEKVDPEGPLAVGSLEDLIGVAAGMVYRRSGLWPESRKLVCDAVAAAYAYARKNRYTRAIEGIPAMVRRLKEKGYKMAVVTTDDTESARNDMQVLGLADCFDAVLGCDRVANCKPFPDLALEACRLLGVSPEKAAVVGDTRADMLMGRNAGLCCTVGVASGVSTADRLAEHADIVLKSAADLTIILFEKGDE